MLQFTSPRTRLFRKKRRGLRYIVIPALAFVAIGACAALITSDGNMSSDVVLAETSPMEVPVTGATIPHDSSVGSMKSAFENGYKYNSEQPAGKTAVLSKIQSGISTLLQAGSDLLVSEKKLSVGKGDTLMDLLVRNNVPRDEAYVAIQALSKVYDPRALNPNHEITVFFHQDPTVADPKFNGLQIEKDTVNTVHVNRTDDGSFKAGQEEKSVHRTMNGFRGNIDSSLYVSAKAQGVPDAVILDLIKLYSWNVDFQRDIQSGDKFEVMYEDYVTEDGLAAPGKGDIVYAMLTLDGREMPIYRYTDRAGDTGYYDDKGQGAKKSLMKTPIDGARISSGFGLRRHPVLGYSKMHKGIDFAAPRGTPIYAAGDGKIEKIGPFSSYGKYIRIRHQSGISTAYAHLNGFKSGLKSGSRVKQGQIIGYVGTTGRSTGPHLHYEIMMNGKQVNPKSMKLPTGKSLAGKDLSSFKTLVAQVGRQFDKLGQGTVLADSAAIKRRAARN